MAHCTSCRAKIGLLGRTWTRFEGEKLCYLCFEELTRQRSDRHRRQLLAEEPDVLARAFVAGVDPCLPKGKRRLIGVLLLTGSGLTFAVYQEYRKQDNSLLLGMLGALMDGIVNRRRHRQALAQIEPLRAIPRQDLASIIENAQELYHFPMEQIDRIQANSRRCGLRRKGHKTLWFQWADTRKEIREFRREIRGLHES